MADTSIAITPGTGAQVDARSQPGGDLRQVVTIGDGDATPIATVDAAGMHVHPGKATAASATVVGGTITTGTTLIAANTARQAAVIFNDSAAVLYVKLGSAATSTSFTEKLEGFETWYHPDPNGVVYTGIVTGVWDQGTGNARITELT